ncbi:Two component system response regulator/histidine kinase, solute-binding domain-containing [Desulfonema limicola]|uniref:histidine kinase n=1 Tax=Desulfonema limicola TaxID=45656 RepID=A0A975GI12_9BACT|nr:Two component system response regulator/histidine kinase, solute-binding domain-containing [Desulfonema limicola]
MFIVLAGHGLSHASQLCFDLDAPSYREREAFAIARQLGRIGIKVKVSILDKEALNKKIKKGSAQAYLTDWGSAFFDPFDLAQPKLTTRGRGNFSFYSNEKIDELLELGISSSSTRKRKQAYHEIQAVIFKEAPWVFGYTLANIEAVSHDLKNFTPAVDNQINLHDVSLAKGETFIAGMNTDAFQSLDPALYRSRETEAMLGNMFDALVARNNTGMIVPELAESWVQKDDKTYIFRLRKDVQFHNSDIMTAQDVVFTFNRILTPGFINGRSSPRRDLLGPLNRIEKIDNRHVKFILDKPFPVFLQALAHFQIVPEKYINMAGNSGFANNPIGTGPFKFVSGDINKAIVMENFPGYYGGSPDLPPAGPAMIKNVIFKTMPRAEDRVKSLLAGEVSLIQAVPAHMVNILKNYQDIKVLSVWGTRSYQIELNNKIKPFNDVRVRQALNHAINWNAILNNIYMGYGRRLATCFLPGGFGYDHSLKPYIYDIWEAGRLLEQAGYDLKKDNGNIIDNIQKEDAFELNNQEQVPISFDSHNYKKVNIAISCDSAPFYYIDKSGHPDGMFVDLWKLWSEKTGIKVEFTGTPWNETLLLMKNRKADIHAGIFKSSDRDIYLDYVSPMYQCETHYFFHKSIYDINDFEDILPFRIGVIKGDFAVNYTKNRLPGAVLSIYRDNQELFNAVKNGDIRVFITDTPVALHYLTQHNILRQFRYNASAPLYNNMFYSAVPEGSKELVNIINQGMDAVSKKERAEIIRKWMGMSDIKTDDVLVISIPDENMPFAGLNFEGRPAGMFVDIWELWAEKTGKKIEFRVSGSNDLVYSLETGEADICSGIFLTKKNQEKIDFSQPFYRIASNIFFLENGDNDLSDKDLSGYKSGAVSGSYHLDYLRENFPESEIVVFPDTRTMIKDTLEKKIDLYFENIPVSEYYLERLQAGWRFTSAKEPLFTENVYAGVKKGNKELLSIIDTGFDAVTYKELSEIEKKWINLPEIRQLKEEESLQIRLTANEKEWLKQHKNLKIGVDPAWPPFDYLDNDGITHMGMASDYVKLLNHRLGISMTVVPDLSWSEVVHRAQEKTLDIIACITKTSQRETFLNFTEPYISFPLVIIVRKESPLISNINDLSDKIIAVTKDYAAHQYLENDYPDIKLALSDTPAQGLELLYTGKADAYLGNLAVTSFLIQKLNIANLKVAAPANMGQDFEELRFGVRRDWPELVSILNKGLASISQKERTEIQQKWFAVRFEYGINMAYVRSLLLKTGTAAVIIIIVILFWNRSLKKEIAERMKIETALRHARDEADAANKAKSTFLANMSHEIRTPMNAILGFSQIMLRDQTLQADQKENIKTIWRSGEHLLGLINDILEMSKIEAGREKLNQNDFDLYALMEDMENMFKLRTDAAGLEFKVEKNGLLPQYIKTDEGKLRQVLINLLGNAVKFTAQGSIILRVSSDTGGKTDLNDNSQGYLYFEIEDTGPGIAQEEQGKLFQYFEQTASGRKTEGGTGLGLAISANYAALMGGSISVSSREGAGSIFRFHISIAKGKIKESSPETLPGYVIRIKPDQPEIRILIADDRQTNRDVLVKMLSSVGFQVREAVNGLEAVNIFEAWSPHLILMDMIMPEMDGFEATKIIKSMPEGKETIIFAVSASVLEYEEKKIIQLGAAEFIRKPFRENELFEFIRKHTQVDYQYEENNSQPETDQKTAHDFPLTGSLLNALPSELKDKMYDAVINGYRKKILEYIQQAEEYDKRAAHRLLELANQYEYEKLADILEP